MSLLGRVFSGSQAVLAFSQASSCLREVECDLKTRLVEVGERPKALRFPHLELPPQAYWERNFFSILFVSLFQAMGIEAASVRHYAAIIHLVRGVVTATDNILDDESKGALIIDLRAGRVLPNVLSMLLQVKLLQDSIRQVAADEDTADRAWGALIDALYAIGEEESGEEKAVEDVLPPKELLDQIHRYRGANLLLLAFVVPELNEPHLGDLMAHAKAGVFRIGLALQILDDLADFEEDIRRRNHNMLRSWLVHGSLGGPRVRDGDLSACSPAQLAAPQDLFPKATGDVMVMAIELALRGFDRLRSAGHPLDRAMARELMAAMFRLRGLPHLWDRYLAAAREVDVTSLEPYFEGL